MTDVLAFLALPFAASAIFVGIHTYLGLHVLRRNVVFADLALAQLSALGATAAFTIGYPPASLAGFSYALLFTGLGAVLLTASRRFARSVSQEAIVGILYVTATAATILLIDRAPQGAEHVKRMLIGSILTVEPGDLVKFAVLYGAIGLMHWIFRRPLLAVSQHGKAGQGNWRVAFWDLAFFLSFGVVVTSSVAAAGVLLVFSFLIIPAVIGTLFSRRIAPALVIGSMAGIVASACGLLGSFLLDLPTGAAMVVAFVIVLALGGLLRALAVAPRDERLRNRRRFRRAIVGLALAIGLAASLWLLLWPTADQPLLALAERAAGIGPERFLSAGERATFLDAEVYEARYQRQLADLNARERDSRWHGARLSDEDVRRMGSYQRSFNEMGRGERFVQDILRVKARERERWYVGAPAALFFGLGLTMLLGWLRLHNVLQAFVPGLRNEKAPTNAGHSDVGGNDVGGKNV
jgi:zinc/manganese transport system permease protein